MRNLYTTLNDAMRSAQSHGRQLFVMIYDPKSGVEIMYSESNDPSVVGKMMRMVLQELKENDGRIERVN